jgi:hypothetical protein
VWEPWGPVKRLNIGFCNRQGFMKPCKENEEPHTDKRSMRFCCPAYAKVKEDKKRKIWYFNRIGEAHNHKL